jgi:hypothetical protein
MTRETPKVAITRDREGPIQRVILATLTRLNNLTVLDLTAIGLKIEREKATDIHIRSMKRALKRLIETGKVIETRFRTKNGEKQYSLVGGAQRKRERKPPPRKPLSVVK